MFPFVSWNEIVFNLAFPSFAVLLCAFIIAWKSNKQTTNSFLGVLLGVILGVGSTLIQEGIIALKNKSEFRQAAFIFLKQDTDNIYTTIWTYRRMDLQLRSLMTPPKFYLNNWSILKQNDQFVSLITIKPFDKIYKFFWQFEEINMMLEQSEIDLDNNKMDKGRLIWAKHLFNSAADKRSDAELLRLFMADKEVAMYEKEFDSSHKSYAFTNNSQSIP